MVQIPLPSLSLKGDTQLCLELTRACLAVRQVAEITGGGIVYRNCRSNGERIRMIQHVNSVHAELQRFSFSDPEALAQVCIEAESAGHFECGLTEVALSSRLRVLEH